MSRCRPPHPCPLSPRTRIQLAPPPPPCPLSPRARFRAGPASADSISAASILSIAESLAGKLDATAKSLIPTHVWSGSGASTASPIRPSLLAFALKWALDLILFCNRCSFCRFACAPSLRFTHLNYAGGLALFHFPRLRAPLEQPKPRTNSSQRKLERPSPPRDCLFSHYHPSAAYAGHVPRSTSQVEDFRSVSPRLRCSGRRHQTSVLSSLSIRWWFNLQGQASARTSTFEKSRWPL